MVGVSGVSERPDCSRAFRKPDTRRWKANSRERSRMHCLNAALDRIRLLMPVEPRLHQNGGLNQKLSKIETLRLAINYISALQTSLTRGKPLDLLTFWQLLSRGLSQQTSQLVGASLRLHALNKWPSIYQQTLPQSNVKTLHSREAWLDHGILEEIAVNEVDKLTHGFTPKNNCIYSLNTHISRESDARSDGSIFYSN